MTRDEVIIKALEIASSDQAWKRAVDIAQIVSAVATFATVVVAARLWSKQFSSKVRVSISKGVVTGAGHPRQDVVHIRVVNTGLVPVIVASIQYRLTVWSRDRYAQLPDWSNPLSSQLPLNLAPAEVGQFLLNADDWMERLVNAMAETKPSVPKGIAMRLFRAQVMLTTGEVFECKLSKPMRKAISARAEAL